MYFTDRGIEELEARRGEETVTLEWVAARLREFVDVPGSADDVAVALADLRDAGVDLVILRFWFDVTAGPRAWDSMARFAATALTEAGTLQ